MNIFLLIGMACGAALMYLLDPQGGKQRRTLLREQVAKAVSRSNKELPNRIQSIRGQAHRAFDIVNEAQSHLRNRPGSEQNLLEQIRTKVKQTVAKPDAIEITAHHGHITLSGSILAHEVQPLITEIKSMKGVAVVENRLTVHEEVLDL